MPERRLWISALTFALCLLGSVLLGLIFYGRLMFNPNLVFFQFIGSGILCAAFIVAAESSGPRSVLILGLITYPLMLAITGSNTGQLFLRDAIYVFGLASCVLLSLQTNLGFKNLNFGKFVFWGAIFGALHFFMFAILSIAKGAPFDFFLAGKATQLGTLVGAGIGLGYEISASLRRRILPVGQ